MLATIEKYPALAESLWPLAAYCYVRDAETAMAAEEVNEHLVADLARPLYSWIKTGHLSIRTANALTNGDWVCMADVWGLTDGELLRAKNFGRMCLTEIRDLLREQQSTQD